MSFADWTTSAAGNGSTLGVNIAENCPPSNVNNALREIMGQMRTAINPVMDSFLSSTSLSSAATALGVSPGSTSVTAFGALTNAANMVPYMTGSDAWATTSLTSFARSMLDDGDAATVRATIGALGLTSGTFGTNTIDVRLTLGNGDTFVVKGGTGTLASNTTATLSFGMTFGAAPVVLVSGGDADFQSEGQIRTSGVATTTGVPIINAGPASGTYNWIAFGKL